MGCKSDRDLSRHCLEYTHPDFRESARAGFNIIVAGKAFGCGSSREEAPRALKGLGVQCVIARSFSFIYGRNQPTIALLGVLINDDEFYKLAETGVEIQINVPRRCVSVAEREFSFTLDEMELSLIRSQGLAQAFLKYGNEVFAALCDEEKGSEEGLAAQGMDGKGTGVHLEELDKPNGPGMLAW